MGQFLLLHKQLTRINKCVNPHIKESDLI
jgi:hypothetical protein